MKGERKRRISAFKSGHIPHNKGIKCIKTESVEETDNKSTIYLRPTKTEVSLVLNNPLSGTQISSDETTTIRGETLRMLRPRPAPPLEVEKKNMVDSKSW